MQDETQPKGKRLIDIFTDEGVLKQRECSLPEHPTNQELLAYLHSEEWRNITMEDATEVADLELALRIMADEEMAEGPSLGYYWWHNQWWRIPDDLRHTAYHQMVDGLIERTERILPGFKRILAEMGLDDLRTEDAGDIAHAQE
jgi:hypothetical protein